MERTRRSTRTERKHGCLVIFTIEATINSCSSSQKTAQKSSCSSTVKCRALFIRRTLIDICVRWGVDRVGVAGITCSKKFLLFLQTPAEIHYKVASELQPDLTSYAPGFPVEPSSSPSSKKLSFDSILSKHANEVTEVIAKFLPYYQRTLMLGSSIFKRLRRKLSVYAGSHNIICFADVKQSIFRT